MTIYVDAITRYPTTSVASRAQRYGQHWCHLWADTREELDEMADRLGLLAWWIQFPDNPTLRHYDLTPNRRSDAIAAGAVEMEYLEYRRAKERETGGGGES